MKQPNENLIYTELSEHFVDNIKRFKTILNYGVNSDAQFRIFNISDKQICIIYIEGMADDRKISEFVLNACLDFSCAGKNSPSEIDINYLISSVFEISQCKTENRVDELVKSVIAGMTIVLLEDSDEAVLMETRGYPSRPVSHPTNESVVIGSQEGFVESLRTNMTLLRRYVQSPHLITESLSAGTRIPTRICIAYINGVADENIINAVRERIKRIQEPIVQGIGAVQQLIEDNPYSLLPQFLQTERPDRAASCLMDGQVAILAENSPYALIAPATIFHQIHASDDTFMRWQYGTFLRLIRILGILLSVFLPGIYIALTSFHMHLIPMSLLTSIAESRANVPFPMLVEVLIMEFSFYLINEAGTRIPQQIGSALGIVGALILGQAAVSASIISPILIIIVALTGLGNYAAPNYSFGSGLQIYRLFVIFSGAILGLYGVTTAAFCLLIRICSLKSLGISYVSPLAPPRKHNPDIILRLPIWLQKRLMFFARGNSWLSEKGGSAEQ